MIASNFITPQNIIPAGHSTLCCAKCYVMTGAWLWLKESISLHVLLLAYFCVSVDHFYILKSDCKELVPHCKDPSK